MLIEIEENGKCNQSQHQLVRWKEQFPSLADESERRAHSIGTDRCWHVREKANHHGRENLEVALDTSGEHDPLVFNEWDGDSCTTGDFADGAMNEARCAIHEVSHHMLFFWKQFYQLQMTKRQNVQEYLSNFQKIRTNILSIGEKWKKIPKC